MSAERLSIWQAAWVIARRDFLAILFSRAFIFFLLGPLFPLVVGVLAGGVGQQVQQSTSRPEIGVAMAPADAEAMIAAHDRLAAKLGPALPEMVRLEMGDKFDPEAVIKEKGSNVAAVVSGTPEAPVLTSTEQRLGWWKGSIELIAANAHDESQTVYPEVATKIVATSGANDRSNRVRTAQAALTLLFLLIMLLAGMVLSNLVEEKGNKIIEILAAAIPMDAVFLGKLFAMLGVSFVGVALWGTAGFAITEIASTATQGTFLDNLTAPGVGWPLFYLFGVIYFAMGYLLLGSIFLAVGSMATTVREVQTLSMPATMAQLLVFFFATYALAAPKNGPVELTAIAFPLSSPYAMLARAATDEALWPHLIALGWQAIWVAIFIKIGANLFRRRVMKSGPQGVKKKRRGLFGSRKPAVEPGTA